MSKNSISRKNLRRSTVLSNKKKLLELAIGGKYPDSFKNQLGDTDGKIAFHEKLKHEILAIEKKIEQNSPPLKKNT